MKRILVFQHAAYEILGTFHPLLKSAGIRIRYINFVRHPDATANVSDYEGLVILGGPMGVWEKDRHPHLIHEIECIQKAIAEGKPVLGICLGAQLIAAALGADVRPAKEKEIGWHDLNLTEAGKTDPVLGVLQSSERVFQWHQDALELPLGSQWLAQSNACKYQAFRYGDRTYGFQFHLEVDQPMIERWLNLPDHQCLLTPEAMDQIRSETFQRIEANTELSRRVFRRYLELFSSKKIK